MGKKQKKKIEISGGGSLKQNPFAVLGDHFKEALPTSSKSEPAENERVGTPETTANPMLLVRLEKRAKGKKMTCIYHVETDPSEVLKQLKRRLATGGNLEDGVIALQGDHREAAATYLLDKGFKVRRG